MNRPTQQPLPTLDPDGRVRDDPARRGEGGETVAAMGASFAAVIMLILCLMHAIMGFTAIAKDDFFVTVDNYAFNMNLTGWGWAHVGLAALLFLVGIGVLARWSWAYAGAIALAALSLIDNFMFIPYYPVWSLIVIALDIFVIWALANLLYAKDPA